jgi:hypothetical protein
LKVDPKRLKKIAPGVYIDAGARMHCSLPEILEHMNAANTPENRAKLEAMIRDVFAQKAPECQFSVADEKGEWSE